MDLFFPFDLKKNGEKNPAQFSFCVSVLSVKNVTFDMGQDLSLELLGDISGTVKKLQAKKKIYFQQSLPIFSW